MAPSSRCGLQRVNCDIYNSDHVADLFSTGVVSFASASSVELAISGRCVDGTSDRRIDFDEDGLSDESTERVADDLR